MADPAGEKALPTMTEFIPIHQATPAGAALAGATLAGAAQATALAGAALAAADGAALAAADGEARTYPVAGATRTSFRLFFY